MNIVCMMVMLITACTGGVLLWRDSDKNRWLYPKQMVYVIAFTLWWGRQMTFASCIRMRWDLLLESISVGILLVAILEDWVSCLVYRFLWGLFMICAVGAYLVCNVNLGAGHLMQWICFCALQYLFFSRLYGLADCHGFCCFGFLLLLNGNGLQGMLMQMLLSILFLGVVQLLKRNVNKYGNLKQPVAFLPYIGAAFVFVY